MPLHYLNTPVLWSIGRRGRGLAGMRIPWGSCTSPGILALPGLGRFAWTFWQKIRHLLCVRWQLTWSLEHLSRACVPNSGTSSSSPVPKAFLEFNAFISLKCCSEFRGAKRQSSDSDGKNQILLHQHFSKRHSPEVSSMQMYQHCTS